MSELSESVRRELREQLAALQQLVAGGHVDAATTACHHIRDRLDGLLVAHPDSAELLDLRAAMLTNLADLAEQRGEWARAEASWREALPLLEQLARSFPQLPRYRQLLGQAQYRLGELYLLTYQPAKAEPAIREAILAWESANGDRHSLARAYAKWGESQRQLRRGHDAVKHYTSANQRFEQLADLGEDVAEEWIHVRRQLGLIHRELGQPAEAIHQLQEAVALERRHPITPDRRAQLLADLGIVYQSVGQPDGAEEAIRRSLALIGESGSDWFDRGQSVALWNRLGVLYLDTGRLNRAAIAFRTAVERGEGYPDRDLATPVHTIAALSNLLRVQRFLGRRDALEPIIGRILTMLHGLKSRFPDESVVESLEESVKPILSLPESHAMPEVKGAMLTWRLPGPPPLSRHYGTAPDELREPLEAIRSLVAAGNYQEAIDQLVALLPRSRSLALQFELIDLLRITGREEPAIQAIGVLLRDHPKFADGWYLQGLLLGRFLDESGGPAEPLDFVRHEAAVDSFDQAIFLEPEIAEFRLWKGRALFRLAHALLARNSVLRSECRKLGREDSEAISIAEKEYHVTLSRARESFMAAARLAPDDAEPPFALGVLLSTFEPERVDEARAAFQHALKLRPDFTQARVELARLP